MIPLNGSKYPPVVQVAMLSLGIITSLSALISVIALACLFPPLSFLAISIGFTATWALNTSAIAIGTALLSMALIVSLLRPQTATSKIPPEIHPPCYTRIQHYPEIVSILPILREKMGSLNELKLEMLKTNIRSIEKTESSPRLRTKLVQEKGQYLIEFEFSSLMTLYLKAKTKKGFTLKVKHHNDPSINEPLEQYLTLLFLGCKHRESASWIKVLKDLRQEDLPLIVRANVSNDDLHKRMLKELPSFL